MTQAPLALLLALAACDSAAEPQEITTIILELTAPGINTIASYNDPDGAKGSQPPLIDSPLLTSSVMYTLSVRFQNRLAMPIAEVTDEIALQPERYLVLLTGTAVVGPATKNTTGPLTHEYADADGNGVPIGLTNTITTRPGSGMLSITLRDIDNKSSTTIDRVRDQGVNSVGGSTRISATFNVQVF